MANERKFDMQCKLSYLVWKIQIMWPLIDYLT